MSSFPSPDKSSITNSPEDSRLNVEHSTLPFSVVETARGKEAAGPEPELQAILEQAMERTGATGAAIALSTEDSVCCRASTGAPAAEVGTRLNAGIGLTGLCLGTGEILLCNETNTDRRVDPQLCKEIGVRSVLVLPIRQNAKVVGVLEVLSVNPDAFNEHDAAEMSGLADQVLPLFSESATIPHRCLHQPSRNDTGALRDPQTRFAHACVLQEHKNRLTTTDAAEAPEWRGHYIGSQLPNEPMTATSHEYPTGTRWLTTGLATALALAAVFGYGYHLNHSRVSTHVAIPPIAGANHKPAIPDQQHVLSEQDKRTDGQPKASDSVLTANTQEAVLAIKGAVQSTDLNRTVNQAEAGDSTAQYEMAVRYADGEGLPQNYRDAMAWFAKAAANGNDNAQWKLGLGYIKGIGVPHDARKAAVWFKRAANHGHIPAQSALSDLYLSGRGVPRDYVRAYTWASIAAGLRGNDNDRLNVIGSRMTAVQIEDAHRRISIWWERQRRGAASPASSERTAMPDVSDR
jgi:TPR repeat protein